MNNSEINELVSKLNKYEREFNNDNNFEKFKTLLDTVEDKISNRRKKELIKRSEELRYELLNRIVLDFNTLTIPQLDDIIDNVRRNRMTIVKPSSSWKTKFTSVKKLENEKSLSQLLSELFDIKVNLNELSPSKVNDLIRFVQSFVEDCKLFESGHDDLIKTYYKIIPGDKEEEKITEIFIRILTKDFDSEWLGETLYEYGLGIPPEDKIDEIVSNVMDKRFRRR